MDIISYTGSRLYHLHRWKEQKRYRFFRFRCWWHKKEVDSFLNFFDESTFRQELLLANPCFLEQITRKFFYYKSTWQERISLIQKHVEILENKFTETTIKDIYTKKPVTIWEDTYKEQKLTAKISFDFGQRKEGCLSLDLYLNDSDPLYQIIFWLGGNLSSPSIYIGAIQGLANGAGIIKELTKAYFGYRTKNLIFYCLRALGKELNCNAIYGVTNEGYYAMNGIRFDRKLKTDFKEFWTECEGQVSEDKRFYKMPIAEHRKSMEELKPSKRAQHRRRFEKLDDIDNQVHLNMQKHLK